MKQRLLSIDILRGMTIMLMVVVNSPGTWDYVAAPLRHSAWNGLTLTDVVFPCFMFIMGMTTYISLRKHAFTLSGGLALKMLRRAAVLFALGLLVNWTAAGLPSLHELRVPGVLQRFAVCYLAVSLLGTQISPRRMLHTAWGLLALYAVLLLAFDGYAYDGDGILAAADRACLGPHMMCDGGIDPEGVLSTLPSVAHVMIGYYMGAVALSARPVADKALSLAAWGAALLFAGLLADSFLPVNKKVWSPTFVLATCGLSLLALALLTTVLDVRGKKMPKKVFLVFGVNPLVCYLLGEFLYIALNSFQVSGETLQTWFYGAFARVLGDGELASFSCALALTAAVGLCGWGLYARKIFVKI